ncbi:methyl-accepting chemotaxis protein [Vreelandella utahensis]|uniref:methyl-accepting chemotaxis protein n=1 Tax=Vreelandella halophila TaxID=86177 RepID=UPI000984C97F|nr:methyl-accepting chemotaxis protein [Halomonas utahensis]
MRELVERVAGDGDLSVRLDAGEKDASAAAFDRLVEQFEGLVRDASGLSQRLQSVSGHVDELSQGTLAAADNLQEQTTQAASAMEEMSSSVRGVADNAAQGSEAATRAATRVGASRQDADLRSLASEMDQLLSGFSIRRN